MSRLALICLLGLTACCMGCPPPLLYNCTFGQIPATWSTARVWNEQNLHAIRQVLPQPTIHARNLFHLSSAMYDAWAAFNTRPQLFSTEKHSGSALEQQTAIAYAANRVLQQRYQFTKNNSDVLPCFDDALRAQGLDPNFRSTIGNSAAAIGNRIGQVILDTHLSDGANESENYADTTNYTPRNQVLLPEFSGTQLEQPSHWQPLLLQTPFTQNNIPQSGPQVFVTPHWGMVKPFAIEQSNSSYFAVAEVPQHQSPQMQTWLLDILRKQATLNLSSETIDTSPAALGNNSLGANDGTGHPQNPTTQAPYAALVQPKGAYWRTVAEYWADGPRSETPPGHWNVVANNISDHPALVRRWLGQGEPLSRLEWDVSLYLVLNGALHDAAIAAWEIKRNTDTARPISLIRHLGKNFIEPELIKVQDSVVLAKNEDAIWRPIQSWMPFQRFDFVTPAFPGLVSGHSTFSHAAAVILENITNSRFFPNGIFEHIVPAVSNRIGQPITIPIKLQWATYRDAADQAGFSRLYGGIHIEPDDLIGRKIGHDIGVAALNKAKTFRQ